MIEGFVNARLEAVVTVTLQGPAGQTQEVDAVIDTGFNGYLNLPMTMADLELPVVGEGEQPTEQSEPCVRSSVNAELCRSATLHHRVPSGSPRWRWLAANLA